MSTSYTPVAVARKDSKDLPAKRQDSTKKYKVTPEMADMGTLKGRTAIYIPEIKATVYTKHPERKHEIRERYINRPLLGEGKMERNEE